MSFIALSELCVFYLASQNKKTDGLDQAVSRKDSIDLNQRF
jgi:hypothetical protein